MSICIVTTLKDSVTDDSLLKIGELLVHVNSNSVAPFQIASLSSGTITIKGSGYFTNESGTSNLGKTIQYEGKQVNQTFYLAAGEYDFVISDKYDITALFIDRMFLDLSSLFGMVRLNNFRSYPSDNITGSIEYIPENTRYLALSASGHGKGKLKGSLSELKGTGLLEFRVRYQLWLVGSVNDIKKETGLVAIDIVDTGITGTLSDICELKNCTEMRISGAKVSGDISAFANKTNLNTLVANGMPAITGNISAFSGKTSINEIAIAGSSVVGNLSSLAGLSSLRVLNLSSTAVTGDTSDLAGLTNLTSFNYTNTAITGTWPLT